LNIQEVVASITDHDWHFEETEYKQNIIHHLAYGITRKHNNLWLIEAEKKWLQSHNVSYKFMPCKRVTLSRGFVYKLMNSTFSNNTIKMIKRAMWSNLGEYITVRDNDGIVNKINSGEKSDLTYEHKTFKNGNGILISRKNKDQDMKTLQVKDQVQKVKEWVMLCMEKQISLPQILHTVQSFYNESFKQLQTPTILCEQNKSLCENEIQNNDLNDTNKITPDKLHHGMLFHFCIYLHFVKCFEYNNNNLFFFVQDKNVKKNFGIQTNVHVEGKKSYYLCL